MYMYKKVITLPLSLKNVNTNVLNYFSIFGEWCCFSHWNAFLFVRLDYLLDDRKTKRYIYYFVLEVQEITIRVIIKRSFVLYMQNTCTLYLNSLMKIKNSTLDSCVIKLSHKSSKMYCVNNHQTLKYTCNRVTLILIFYNMNWMGNIL